MSEPIASAGRQTQPGSSRSFPGGRARSRRADALHVFTLWSFAVAQPIYDRLAERPGFLADASISQAAVAVFAVLLSLALPALIVACEAIAARVSRAAYEALHIAIVFTLLALICLPALKLSALPAVVLLPGSLALAIVMTASYCRYVSCRTTVSLASVAVLIFPAMFFVHPGMRGLNSSVPAMHVDKSAAAPVVVLVFDEFSGTSLLDRDRQIDASLFPNFARLASCSTWFRNATTVHAETWQALPALLSGVATRQSWPPTTAQLPQNLFSLLNATGAYDSAIFEPVSNLAPRQQRRDRSSPGVAGQIEQLIETLASVYLYHISPAEFHGRLPKPPGLWFAIRDSADVDQTARRGVFRYTWEEHRDRQFEHFLRCVDGAAHPSLYFLHVVFPHVPWNYLPSGREYLPDDRRHDLLEFGGHNDLVAHWCSDELAVVQGQQRYLLQLQFADVLLGRLLDRLQETGLWDRCLLVVTADHGVSFRAQQPRRMPDGDALADILSIPLFIKRPLENRGDTSDLDVDTRDVLPTVADVLGFPLWRPVEGRSVFDSQRPSRDGKILVRHGADVVADAAVVSGSDGHLLQAARFGPAGDAQRLYRIGPRVDLIGKAAADLLGPTQTPVEIDCVGCGNVRNVAGALLPCFIGGLVRSPTAETPAVLAVAVNGTIQAVTRTYLLDGLRERFAAMLPESAFEPGDNDVRVYAVRAGDLERPLSECIVNDAGPVARSR